MSVERIEEYRQRNGTDVLKVILKPTKKFPVGSNFFYAPADAIALIRQYTWGLCACGKNVVRVQAVDNDSIYYEAGKLHSDSVLFHAKLFEFYNNYKWQGDIDHANMVEYDNTDQNLEPIRRQQNQYNKLSRGYLINTQVKPASFRACIKIEGKLYRPYSVVRSEAEACNIQNYTEQVYLREKLGSQYYMFDFKKYRRGSQDILNLERTGKISEEEATYQHILRYSGNAWYMLRYGLEQYYIENHIPIPKYSLDSDGFIVHPITGQKLCPF